MDLKIEGANSEVTKKIKGSEAKLLAKGKAKMPNAKEFKVKMRPNLVKASNGTFYGGHLYGTEDGTKWMKCAEVRIREGKKEEGEKEQVGEPASLWHRGRHSYGSTPPETKSAKAKPYDKRALGTRLQSFMDSKLSGLTYKYKFNGITLGEDGEGRMHGEAKVKCTMLRPIDASGRPNKRRALEAAWLDLKMVTDHQIRQKLEGQVMDGWKLTISNVDFGKNAPTRESFMFSLAFKADAR